MTTQSSEDTTRAASFTLQALAANYWTFAERQGEPASTGIATLDTVLGGGFYPERLIALLGGPGSGKTALSSQVAYHAASSGHPVVYLSLEESELAMLAKAISRECDVDYGKVLSADRALEQRINAALGILSSSQAASLLRYIFTDIDHPVITPEMLRAVAQEHFAAHSLSGLIVVDYLQEFARGYRFLHPEDRRDLRECVGWLANWLRQLARDLNCAVVMLSSQRRASGYGTDDPLSSAKESGDIEYCADAVLALKIADNKQNTAPQFSAQISRNQPRILQVAKSRWGGLGEYPLSWRGDRQQMRDARTGDARTSAKSTSAPILDLTPAKSGKPPRKGKKVKKTDEEKFAELFDVVEVAG